MSEISGQASSSLAIVEKRSQRPGGCVGIFFQLLDWNRKLAKKKLFSKKLLPPVRLRKHSNKFAGDEKQPKLRLIADENSGGFPHGKKNNGGCTAESERNNEMRTPGLVARLMGLESIPAARPNKEKNASLSGNEQDKFVDRAMKVVKGETKQELRPQKLQKTGLSERRPVTKVGAEALQLKNVLSRSRKHHQKLVSPVKSPRNVPGRNASLLYGAATRILEPGLQRNRPKCSLTYSHGAEVLMEEAKDARPLENSFNFQSSAKPLNEQSSSSCRNCGHLLEMADIRPPLTEEKQPISSPTSQIVQPSAQVSERCNPRPSIFSPQRHMGANCADFVADKTFHSRECQRQWQATGQQFKLQKDSPTKHKFHGQNVLSHGRERLPSRSKISKLQSCRITTASNPTNGIKDFVVANQNLNDTARPRMPVTVDSYWLDANQKVVDRRNNSLSSPVRKKRYVSTSRQNESSCFVSSSLGKSANNRFNAASGKDRNCSSQSALEPCNNVGLTHLQEPMTDDICKNNAGVVSLTFKSPMKHKTGIHSDVELSKYENVSNEIEARNSLKKLPLTGDRLGALLEQKLKELTSQEEDCAFGDTTPRKSTAMILQELISALTTEKPCHHQDDFLTGETTETSAIFQGKRKSNNNSAGNLPTSEHLSPGSVLEVNFSNESCCSSSLDDSSRCDLGVDSAECYEEANLLEPDANLSDSMMFSRDSVNNLLDNISQVVSSLNLDDVHLKGSKLTHAKDVILNAELVFGNAAPPVNGGFSMSNFLHNQLETLASVMWRNFRDVDALDDDAKEGNQLRGFVFDCFVEYLESRFNLYSNSGLNSWTRLPLRMKTEMLIGEIVEEVGRWSALAGLFPDELIEHDMSHSLGKWTDFELEAFETGSEIGQEILQTLISELLVEFTACNPECC